MAGAIQVEVNVQDQLHDHFNLKTYNETKILQDNFKFLH